MAGKKASSNPIRKARRQRSWLRGEQKNKRNREANELREATNREDLKSLGGTIQAKSFIGKDGKPVTKRESPSEALSRTKRELAGWKGHVPMPKPEGKN